MSMLRINENKKIFNQPFLLFFPFLIFFVFIVILNPTTGDFGDENRYMQYAENLARGFYVDTDRYIYLDNGPGYPLLLAPFIALGLPLICITLLNAVLQYLSIVVLYKALRQIVNLKISLIFSFFWAFYYHSYNCIPLILTEVFTSFLISLLLFYLIKVFSGKDQDNKRKYLFLAGFLVGCIVLTKNIFGYVLMIMLAAGIIFWFFNKRSVNYKKYLLILSIAFITTLPYLIYSYNFSGRVFYWGTLGGNNLYWMTTPYEGEYGSWYPIYTTPKPDSYSEPYLIPGSGKTVKDNHQKEIDHILQYTGIAQDDEYKKIAIRNIRNHPDKFLENCFSNIGRMLFDTPNSYMLQRPGNLLKLPLNGILILLMLFCFIPVVINWKKIKFSIRFLIFFVFLYLGGSVLGSADMRMFTVIVPALLLLIAYILSKTIKVNTKFSQD